MSNRGLGFYWKLACTNLSRNRRVYLPYLLSSLGIIIMFYTISSLSQGIDEEAMYGGSSTASMMRLGVFVIGLFAVLFLGLLDVPLNWLYTAAGRLLDFSTGYVELALRALLH